MKLLFTTCLLIINFSGFGRTLSATKSGKNEFTASLKNAQNLNKADFNSNTTYTTCSNTFSQSIELNYTRRIGTNFLLFAGIEAGHDKYRFHVFAPYNLNNQLQTTETQGSASNIAASIPIAKLSIGAGYRFRANKNLAPEVRLAHVVQTALGRQDLYSEQTVYPSENYYGRFGYLGNGHEGAKTIELLNTLYVGVRYKTGWARFRSINAGIQLQRKFIMTDGQSPFNYFHTDYRDGMGNDIGRDSFSGRHQSVSFVIGATL